MAKSMRSKWRRKMLAVKRKKLEPRVVNKLKETVATKHVPRITELEAAERSKAAIEKAMAEQSDQMEAAKGDQTKNETSKIRPWMNQRRIKRLAASEKSRQAKSAAAKLISNKEKDAPRIKVAMKKRHKGKQRKLNKRLVKLSRFPVA